MSTNGDIYVLFIMLYFVVDAKGEEKIGETEGMKKKLRK